MMFGNAASSLTAVAVAAAFSAAPTLAKTFKWASASDIPTWDIHSQNNALANGIHAAVYESLFYYNKKFELEPMLATGYRQISPTQECASRCAKASSSMTGRRSTPMTPSSRSNGR